MLIMLGCCLVLITNKGFAVCMTLLLFWSAYELLKQHHIRALPTDIIFLLLINLYPLVVFFNAMLKSNIPLREFDIPSRFILYSIIYLALRKKEFSLTGLAFGSALATVIIAIFSLIQAAQGMELGPEYRVEGFDNAITYAQISLLITGFALLPSCKKLNNQGIHLTKNISIFVHIYTFLLITFGLMSCFLTQTRGVIILFPFLIFIFLKYHLNIDKAKPQKIILTFVLVLLPILAVLLMKFDYIAQLPIEIYDVFFSNGELDPTSSSGVRIGLWKLSLIAIAEKPLFGYGAGSFGETISLFAQSANAPAHLMKFRHAHNEFLNLGVELGLVGVSTILLLNLYTIRLSIKEKFAIESRYIIIFTSVCWLAFGVTSSPLSHHKILLLILLMLVVGFAYGMNQKYGLLKKQ